MLMPPPVPPSSWKLRARSSVPQEQKPPAFQPPASNHPETLPPPAGEAPPDSSSLQALAEAVEPAAFKALDLDELGREILHDLEIELKILGMLYREKKREPDIGAIFVADMAKILGVSREALAFPITYLKMSKHIESDDRSRVLITVSGIEYLRRGGSPSHHPHLDLAP